MRTLKIVELTSFREKTKGLMFTKKIKPIYFRTRWGLHTVFVTKPIDIVILDDDFVIRKLKKGLHPWTVFVWNPKYKNILEMPSGSINKYKLKLGKGVKIKTH